MTPGGFFDFTFDRTEGTEHQVLREDFYYRTQTLIDLARRHGLQAEFMAGLGRDRARAVQDPGDSPGIAVRDIFLRVRRPDW